MPSTDPTKTDWIAYLLLLVIILGYFTWYTINTDRYMDNHYGKSYQNSGLKVSSK